MVEVKKSPVISYIKWRIHKNKNCIIVINGATGSGKTYAGLRLAYELSLAMKTNFNVNDNVSFKYDELVKKTWLPQNKKPGTPFVFEEVGAYKSGASAKQHQAKSNLMFNSFLQTTRSRNQILIMTTPIFASLDKASRELVHIQMDMVSINYVNKTARVRPYRLQTNNRSRKIYYKLLRFKHEGKQIRLSNWDVKLPPQDILDQYEEDKKQFQKDLDKIIIEGEKKKRTNSYVDPELVYYLRNKGQSIREIARRLNCSRMGVQGCLKREDMSNIGQEKSHFSPL